MQLTVWSTAYLSIKSEIYTKYDETAALMSRKDWQGGKIIRERFLKFDTYWILTKYLCDIDNLWDMKENDI